NDAVTVALILRAPFRGRFGVFAAARVGTELRIRREVPPLHLLEFFAVTGHALSANLQAPNTKLHRNTNSQAPNRRSRDETRKQLLKFGTWCFSGACRLVLGINFRPHS